MSKLSSACNVMYHTTTFYGVFSTEDFIHRHYRQRRQVSNKHLSLQGISFWRRRLSKGGNPGCIAEEVIQGVISPASLLGHPQLFFFFFFFPPPPFFSSPPPPPPPPTFNDLRNHVQEKNRDHAPFRENGLPPKC